MPGQTSAPPGTDAPDGILPSMEGRAIARPNVLKIAETSPLSRSLQWRAGQLPGQTRTLDQPRTRGPGPFNGGPGNCPAKPGPASSIR